MSSCPQHLFLNPLTPGSEKQYLVAGGESNRKTQPGPQSTQIRRISALFPGSTFTVGLRAGFCYGSPSILTQEAEWAAHLCAMLRARPLCAYSLRIRDFLVIVNNNLEGEGGSRGRGGGRVMHIPLGERRSSSLQRPSRLIVPDLGQIGI